MAWRALVPNRTAECHPCTRGHYPSVREVPLLWELTLEGLTSKRNPPKSLEHYREHRWSHETVATTSEIGSCLTPKKLTHDYSAPSPLPVTITRQEFLPWSSKIRTCWGAFWRKSSLPVYTLGFMLFWKQTAVSGMERKVSGKINLTLYST